MANKIERHNRPPATAGAKLLGKTGPEAMSEKQQADIQRQMQEQMANARHQARLDAMQGAIDHPSEIQQYVDFSASMTAISDGASVIMLGLPSGKRIDVLLSPETSKALAAALQERVLAYELDKVEQESAEPELAEAA